MTIADDFYLHKPSNELPDTLTTRILEKSDARAYHESMPVYQSTPLHHLPGLAAHYGLGDIYVKDESQRFGLNAFKGLGPSYAIHTILQQKRGIEVFCTATDGNHGRAVAWAARQAGKEAVIFVPENTTRARIEAIEKEGARVEKIDDNYDQTCAHAREISEKRGWQLVQDTAWEGYEEIPALIMAGYLTQFQELEIGLHSLPKPPVDLVFLQAGVGSWAAAAVWYYLNRYGEDRPKIVIVEPAASDGILESFKQGRRARPTGKLDSMMAGLNCGIPSLSAWEILQSGIDAVMRIEDSYSARAMRELFYPKEEDPHIVSGESGAAGLGGFIALMTDPRFSNLKNSLDIDEKSRVLLYSTEGATDPENFQKVVDEL